MSYSDSVLQLAEILPETASKFPPVDKNIQILIGKTLFRNANWHKALLLVKDRSNKLQLRFYAWQKYKNGTTKVRQKFNISISSLFNLCRLLEKINNIFEKRAQQQYLEELRQQKLKEQLRAHPRFIEKDYP